MTRNVPQTVRRLLESETWKGITPYQINDGECCTFAGDLTDALGGEDNTCHQVDACSFAAFGDLPTHVWVWCDGRHYDAECPDGVVHWLDLPIFRNCTAEPTRKFMGLIRSNPEMDERGFVKPEFLNDDETGEEYADRVYGSPST